MKRDLRVLLRENSSWTEHACEEAHCGNFKNLKHFICMVAAALDEGGRASRGVGAYDSISRSAMFRGFMDVVDGEKLVPFVRLFYDSPQRTFGKTRSGMFGTCCKEKVANKETP